MNDMKLKKSFMMACLALFSASFASCTDDALIEASDKYVGQPFELTVNQSNSDSRLELGQDGLSTVWEPGDKLVLVDKTRTLAPIFLNCTLKEKSNTATFVAENGVPAGDYYVIYNYNESLAYGHKKFQSIDQINSDDDLVLWNELSITEGDSNASISLQHMYAKVRVILQNAPTHSGMGFQIGMYSSKKGFPANKMFTNSGLVDAEYGINPNSMNYTHTSTYFPSNRKFHNIRFGRYACEYVYDEETDTSTEDWSKVTELSALVLPADLSDEDIYFYVIDNNKCYEIKKSGVNIKGGTSYKVVLDLNKATISELTWGDYMQIEDAADWRHAAYRNEMQVGYELTQDIDFKQEAFFPIAAHSLYGGNHTLSNIELDWADEDNVGLARNEWDEHRYIGVDHDLGCAQLMDYVTTISDLTIENITIKGNNFVGAFGGWNINVNNCKVIGTSVVEGKGNYVGGIVGINRLDSSTKLINVRIGQNCSVSGKNYVGGIVGRYVPANYYGSLGTISSSMMLLESCKSEGKVTGIEDYVGGIFGKMGGSYFSNNSNNTSIDFAMDDFTFSLIKCENEGTVTGRHYVGGVGGDFAVTCYNYSSTLDRVVLSQSSSNGKVTGDTKVGGILGSTQASVNICYSTSEVSASTSAVGGIVGDFSMGYQARIANCYSLATISGTNVQVGGIIGNAGGGAMGATILNCYYAADPNTYSYGGIVGYSGGSVTVSNCLTTLNSLGYNLGVHLVPTGCPDDNNDGIADWDWNNDGIINMDDLYYNYGDNISNSLTAVTSILANKNIINGDNAYSSSIWPIATYPWECVKFANFSADTNSPDYNDDTI